MRIVLYGRTLGDYGHPTEMPFLLGSGVERIYKNSKELQDLEADIAIANFTRPSWAGEDDWNFSRLPKVKVQLAIQAEHYTEYQPEHDDLLTKNFDGSIAYEGNKPFWENSKKPVFYFDPFCLWKQTYTGPIKEFKDYGYILGGPTEYRDKLIRNNPMFRYMWGNVNNKKIQDQLKESGVGFNVHKYIGDAKTEYSRMSLYINFGMAVVTETLDETLPERFRDYMIETSDIEYFEIDKDVLKEQTMYLEKVLKEYHDINEEQRILFNNIKTTYGI